MINELEALGAVRKYLKNRSQKYVSGKVSDFPDFSLVTNYRNKCPDSNVVTELTGASMGCCTPHIKAFYEKLTYLMEVAAPNFLNNEGKPKGKVNINGSPMNKYLKSDIDNSLASLGDTYVKDIFENLDKARISNELKNLSKEDKVILKHYPNVAKGCDEICKDEPNYQKLKEASCAKPGKPNIKPDGKGQRLR